jgi:hypothetical protein
MLRFDGLAQDGIMALMRNGHRVGLFLPQAGAAFDIGEQKGDCAGREVCAHVLYEFVITGYYLYIISGFIASEQDVILKAGRPGQAGQCILGGSG